MSREYEAAGVAVEAALREYHGAVESSMHRSATALWPIQGAAWVELAAAVKRHADLARDSGERPERMVVLLKRVLEETMPRDDRAAQLRDAVVTLSIDAYFGNGE